MRVDTELDVHVEITHHLFGYDVKLISMIFYIILKFLSDNRFHLGIVLPKF